jgi:ankyrin repeat protein
VVQLLLEKGVDISARDNSGLTALYNMVYYSNEAEVRLLLENRVDVETRHTITDFEGRGLFVQTFVRAINCRDVCRDDCMGN